MEVATVREAVNLTNNTKAITPYTLRQVLSNFSGGGGGGGVDPSLIPTKLSQLTNDMNFVGTVNGKFPNAVLPSFVDDVLEYESISAFPNPGEAGKIYVAIDTSLTYRWGGSSYVEISPSLALGTTSSTAFRGDYGQTSYIHATTTGNAHNMTLSDLSITVSTTEINFLAGLNENIITALAKKLNLSGGTMTGMLFLSEDPYERMHAATKNYVDNEIAAIGVKVTQNVTKIGELAHDIDGLTSTVGAQADTIVDVQNDLRGLQETTTDHTEYITNLQQDVSSITSTVREVHSTVDVLEATVNQLSINLAYDNILIPVDSSNRPLNSAVYEIPYEVVFRGHAITPDEFDTEASYQGITMTKNASKIFFSVTQGVRIQSASCPYLFEAEYENTLTYTAGAMIIISTIPKGEQGTPGQDAPEKFTWVKYADTPTTGMSDSPTGKKYIGIAYNKLTSEESTNYEDYSWSLIKGEDGQPGAVGPQGVSFSSITNYYGISVSEAIQPTNWFLAPPTRPQGYVLWVKELVTDSAGNSTFLTPYTVTGDVGDDGTVSSTTAPEDTEKLWLDLNTGLLRRYVENGEGEGAWVLVNDYNNNFENMSGDIAHLQEQLAQLNETLASKGEVTYEYLQTQLQQVSDGFSMDFTKVQGRITEVLGQIEEHIQEQNKYIRFYNGIITLGQEGTSDLYTLKIENDKISIYNNNALVSAWNRTVFQVRELRIQEPEWTHSFTFVPRPNGSLSFRKVVNS